MWIASKTPPDRARAWAEDARPHLLDGEFVRAASKCSLLRPTNVDGLLVTNYRLLAFRAARLAERGPAVSVNLGEVAEVQVKGTYVSFNELQVVTGSGRLVRLGEVAKADMADLRQQVLDAQAAFRASPPPPVLDQPLVPVLLTVELPAELPGQLPPPPPVQPPARKRDTEAHIDFGRGARDTSLRRRLEGVRARLAHGEQDLYIAHARSLTPRADALVVTNQRVLSLLGDKVTWELAHADTVSISSTEKEKAVTFTAARGGAQMFKGIEATGRDVIVSLCGSFQQPRPQPTPTDVGERPVVLQIDEPASLARAVEPPEMPAPAEQLMLPPTPEPVAPPAVQAVQAVQAAQTPSPAPTSLADELRKLAALHAEGILSDAEFTAAKRRLIEG